MDHLEPGRRRKVQVETNRNSLPTCPEQSYFGLSPGANAPAPRVPNAFFNSPIELNTGSNYHPFPAPGLHSTFTPPFAPAFGLNTDLLDKTEQFSEQELAELDDYLNQLSQQTAIDSTHTPELQPHVVGPSAVYGQTNNFTETANSGRDLYKEALHQWASEYSANTSNSRPASAARAYDPFNAGIFPYREEATDSCDAVGQTPIVKLNKPVDCKAKPSFAEVAKNNPKRDRGLSRNLSQSSDSSKAELNCRSHESTLINSKSNRRPKSGKSAGQKNRAAPVKPKDIKPDSRYGLDTFEMERKDDDVCRVKGKGGVERGRRNSNSSLSSTMSGEEHPSNNIQFKGLSADTKRRSADNIEPSENQQKEKKGSQRSRNSSSSSGTKIYFDPRRIFQDNHPKASSSTPNHDSYVPNNKQHFPADKDKDKVKASVKGGTTKYINNDLRDTKKQTNKEQGLTTADGKSQEARKRTVSENIDQPRTRMRKPEHVTTANAANSERHFCPKVTKEQTNAALGKFLLSCWQWLRWLLREIFLFLYNFSTLVLSVFLLLLALLLHYAIVFSNKLWSIMKEKVPYLGKENERFDWSKSHGSHSRQRQYGLKDHIVLPATGDEAMKRLLSCKGKDPYSILGVRCDATDEDIKKYYRKQAFLVHPDKNKQPGAEESFKILGHAFDLIGSPERRKEYDSQTDKEDTEAAMHEFADLLSKLNEKMQEAANLLRCDECGGKHKRVPTDRPAFAARFCDRCNVMHPAKEGDVWAESNMLGFLWHYYACMEGKVFNITEWAKCKRDNFNQLQANAHHVIYRLSTTGRSRHTANRGGEADLEDFLNNLFHQTTSGMPSENNSTSQTRPPPSSHNSQKKGRKKKKKH